MTPVSFHINRRTSPSASAGLRTRRSGEARRAEDDFLGIMQIAFPETRASARRYRMRARRLTGRRVDATLEHAEFSSPDAIGVRALCRGESANGQCRKFRERYS